MSVDSLHQINAFFYPENLQYTALVLSNEQQLCTDIYIHVHDVYNFLSHVMSLIALVGIVYVVLIAVCLCHICIVYIVKKAYPFLW